MLRSKAMSNFNVTTHEKIAYPFGSPLGKWTNPLIFGGTLQGPKVHAISRALVASWGLKPAAAANSATLRAIWALDPLEVTKIGGVLRQTSGVNEDTNISDTYLGVMRKYIGHKYIREYLGVMRKKISDTWANEVAKKSGGAHFSKLAWSCLKVRLKRAFSLVTFACPTNTCLTCKDLADPKSLKLVMGYIAERCQVSTFLDWELNVGIWYISNVAMWGTTKVSLNLWVFEVGIGRSSSQKNQHIVSTWLIGIACGRPVCHMEIGTGYDDTYISNT